MRRALLGRLERLARRQGKLLVVLEHAPQVVDTSTGHRTLNVYLDPIADRLRGGRLDPIAIDISSGTETLTNDSTGWSARILPAGVLRAIAPAEEDVASGIAAILERVADTRVPLLVGQIDLGPHLTRHVAAYLADSLPRKLRGMERVRRLLQRLRPGAILLADEYHRQEWLGAAALEGIPVVAVQHGLIYRSHNGYMFDARPPSLRLPDRLYVFGDWERRLLVEESVFSPETVHVGGSPRLDLMDRERPVDAAGIRERLGVKPGDRMVVVSGTWGPMYRRFHLPISLAHLVDRPLPGVHLVVKLHPGEKDDGPYRRVIEGAAAARGFESPPVTLVRSIDLYALLRAADAHIGVQSTVLTEAVVTGTRNLLGSVLRDVDLLGWVAAGVATPVRDGAELLAALDDPSTIPTTERRRAFLDDHFEPGDASGRIAAGLLEWLAPRRRWFP